MVALAVCASASADPYRLRGDALLATQPNVGLLVLQADDDLRPWLHAETMLWSGGGEENDADALIVFVRARDPEARGEIQIGRMVLAMGAIRPIHVDGALGIANAPWGGSRLEVFGGAPVMPRFAERTADWVAGGRVSHKHKTLGTAGLSFIYRQDAGIMSDREVGVDATTRPLKWLDVSARASYDLINLGISDSKLIVSGTRKGMRGQLFVGRRTPSRILPATSLFAALGDIPSDELGATGFWRAAPRLDVGATAILRTVDEDTGADLETRATLRLDDRGSGAVAVYLRRVQIPDISWTGLRMTLRYPIKPRLTFSAEVEVVLPDESGGRGKVWPWALTALRYDIDKRWSAALAVEASSSAEFTSEVNGLFRLTSRWGGAQ